jgi:hypothetical protein
LPSRDAPLPPEAAAAGRRRFKFFLLNIAALLLIGLVIAGRPLLSGHAVRLLEYVAAIVAPGSRRAPGVIELGVPFQGRALAGTVLKTAGSTWSLGGGPS